MGNTEEEYRGRAVRMRDGLFFAVRKIIIILSSG